MRAPQVGRFSVSGSSGEELSLGDGSWLGLGDGEGAGLAVLVCTQ
jgi:hypothetical protein